MFMCQADDLGLHRIPKRELRGSSNHPLEPGAAIDESLRGAAIPRPNRWFFRLLHVPGDFFPDIRVRLTDGFLHMLDIAVRVRGRQTRRRPHPCG